MNETESDGRYHLYAIRTTVGKENTVLEFILSRIKKGNIGIASILIPSGLKGYLIMESQTRDDVLKAIQGITHIGGVLKGEMTLEEVAPYLEAKQVREIPERALVEITNGPFKGEKAKVTRVNKVKEEVTVELIEATVSIPVTVKLDAVRVLEKEASILEEKNEQKNI